MHWSMHVAVVDKGDTTDAASHVPRGLAAGQCEPQCYPKWTVTSTDVHQFTQTPAE